MFLHFSISLPFDSRESWTEKAWDAATKKNENIKLSEVLSREKSSSLLMFMLSDICFFVCPFFILKVNLHSITFCLFCSRVIFCLCLLFVRNFDQLTVEKWKWECAEKTSISINSELLSIRPHHSTFPSLISFGGDKRYCFGNNEKNQLSVT